MSDQEPDNSHPLPPTKAGRTVILAVDSSRHSERQAGLQFQRKLFFKKLHVFYHAVPVRKKGKNYFDF